MHELVHLVGNTYYIEDFAKMGLYIDGKDAYLIDTGLTDESGKVAYDIIESNGWKLKAIINTHIHCDHMGGNHYLQEKTDCQIYCTYKEESFARYRELEFAYLAGGFPPQDLIHMVPQASPCNPTNIIEEGLPVGITAIPLPGHYFNMMGIKTPDSVWFLADALLAEKLVEKYKLFFIHDVRSQLETLDMMRSLEGKFFVPSHAPVVENLDSIINVNKKAILDNIEYISSIIKEPIGPDDLMEKIFDHYGIPMNLGQYALVGSSIRSYLNYLYDEGRAEMVFAKSRMYWQRK